MSVWRCPALIDGVALLCWLIAVTSSRPVAAGPYFENRYLIDEGMFNWDGTGRPSRVPDWEIRQTLTNRECLVEELFPDGNWGPETEGLRMSTRTDKPSYKLYEPIRITVLLRNVSEKIGLVRAGIQFDIVLLDDVNRPIPRLDNPNGLGYSTGPQELAIMVGTQQRYTRTLNDHFSLERPGRFAVYTLRAIGGVMGKPADNVRSELALFEIDAGQTPFPKPLPKVAPPPPKLTNIEQLIPKGVEVPDFVRKDLENLLRKKQAEQARESLPVVESNTIPSNPPEPVAAVPAATPPAQSSRRDIVFIAGLFALVAGAGSWLVLRRRK